MQPKNLNRLLQALARKGLDVTYDNQTYSVRLKDSPDALSAEVLLPESFLVEAKALKQSAHLANVRHPSGGQVCKCCATPDFHPGDTGVTIGSVVETEGMLIPAAYKPIQSVIDAHVEAQMVGVVARLKPVLTFKA